MSATAAMKINRRATLPTGSRGVNRLNEPVLCLGVDRQIRNPFAQVADLGTLIEKAGLKARCVVV